MLRINVQSISRLNFSQRPGTFFKIYKMIPATSYINLNLKFEMFWYIVYKDFHNQKNVTKIKLFVALK